MAKLGDKLARLLTIPITASKITTITGEVVAIPAGAQSTIKDFQISQRPILGSTKEWIGGYGSSSATLTSTAFTTEVESGKADADLADGEYWIDYLTGRGRGKKADASVAMTVTYSVREEGALFDDPLVYCGAIDCTLNPNYPAADGGNLYRISANGKIGGAGGVAVTTADTIICHVDGSATGDQAAVGANWDIFTGSVADVVTGPAAAVDGAVPLFDGVTGKIIKDSGVLLTGGLNTFNITNGTAILDIAAGSTLNIDKGLQITTNAGIIAFTGAGKTLNVEDTSTVNQDLTTDASPTFAAVNATTFDTNVAAAGVTLAGTTLAADGTDVNIAITLTPKGSGKVTLNGGIAGSAFLDDDTFATATASTLASAESIKAYVDTALSGENLWDVAATVISPHTAGDTVSIPKLAIAATPTDGLVLANTTAALVGAQVQMSPRLRLRGNAWDVDDAVTRTFDWTIDQLPVAGAVITSLLRFGTSLAGAGYTYPVTLDNSGAITAGSNTDTVNIFGRLKAGYEGTTADLMALAHFDNMNSTDYGFAQDAAGASIVNAKAGQVISLKVNNTLVASLSNTTLLGEAGKLLSFDANGDTCHIFGRLRAGYDGATADRAVLAHYDQMSATTAALWQNANGTVVVNGVTSLGLAISGTNVASISATALTVSVAGDNALASVRTSSETNTLKTGIVVKHDSDAGMADGFGAGVSFVVNDDGNTDREIGQIGFVRNGGDTTGALVINIATGGALSEKLRLSNLGVLSINGLSTAQSSEVVNDDSEIVIQAAVSGWGFAQAGDNEEYVQFSFTAAGVVTLIHNSANVDNTDADGKFCVYDAGTGIAIKNRLGAGKTVRYVVHYSA